MKALIGFVFVVGLVLTEVVTAQAMPIQRLVQPRETSITQVGYRCGAGVPLDTNINCTLVYRGYHQKYHWRHYEGSRRSYYRGYHDAYQDFPYIRHSGRVAPIAVDKGSCGFGSYLSCAFGGCWRLCY